MVNSWAFKWVQLVLHNQGKVLAFLLVFLAFFLPGLAYLEVEKTGFLMPLGLAFVLMSLVAVKLMASWKTALLIFMFSGVALSVLLGLMGLLSWQMTQANLLGLLVVLIMMTSNLVHVVTGLHREMARGQHQYDAIADALSLNLSPILLSNITTVVGFFIVALFDDAFSQMAWMVFVGFLFTLLLLIVALPLVLLNWLLEFRVGNYSDRHGFIFVARWMDNHPKITYLLKLIFLLVSFISFALFLPSYSVLQASLLMFVSSFLLLALVWKSFFTAFYLVVSGFVAVIWALVATNLWLDITVLSAIVLVVPLGIVLDDGIHFFSRMLRAEAYQAIDAQQKMRFVLSSVGKPIWNTSVLLVVGLLTLTFSEDTAVQTAAWVTVISVIMITLMMLVALPSMVHKR